MKIEYDHEADAVDIRLIDGEIIPGEAKFTYLCDPINGMINLDFDENKVLINIEVMDASKKLPKELLNLSEKKINQTNTRITHNRETDVAYIYFQDVIPDGTVKKRYFCDPVEAKAFSFTPFTDGGINLDFDEKGVLIGIEILDAKSKLSKEILDVAEKIC